MLRRHGREHEIGTAAVSLAVLAGPPGSGRGATPCWRRFGTSLEREPVLVAPTSDDVDRLERDLCAGPGGILGGTVTSFPGLFREVGQVGGPRRRRRAERDAADLARSGGGRRGTAAPARALGPARGLRARPGGAADRPAGLGARRPRLRRSPSPRATPGTTSASWSRCSKPTSRSAIAASSPTITSSPRERPPRSAASRGSWAARPVFLYGFDDLTREQVELVGALADACEVTVTVTLRGPAGARRSRPAARRAPGRVRRCRHRARPGRPRAAGRRRCGISSGTCSSPIRPRSLPTDRCACSRAPASGARRSCSAARSRACSPTGSIRTRSRSRFATPIGRRR